MKYPGWETEMAAAGDLDDEEEEGFPKQSWEDPYIRNGENSRPAVDEVQIQNSRRRNFSATSDPLPKLESVQTLEEAATNPAGKGTPDIWPKEWQETDASVGTLPTSPTNIPESRNTAEIPNQDRRIARLRGDEVFGRPSKSWLDRGSNDAAPAANSAGQQLPRDEDSNPKATSRAAVGSAGAELKPTPADNQVAMGWDGMGDRMILVSEADRSESERAKAETDRARAAADQNQPQIIIREGDRPMQEFGRGLGEIQEAGAPAKAKEEPPLEAADMLEDVWNNPGQLIPYWSSAKELYDIGKIGLAAYRLSEADKDGNEADPADLKLVRDYVAHQNRATTPGYEITRILAALPAMAGEFATSAGIYTVGEKAALKAGTLALKKFGSKAGAELLERLAARSLAKKAGKEVAGVVGKSASEKALELTARGAAATAGAALQTVPASGLRVASETIQRMMPEFDFSEDERGQLSATVAREGDDFGTAMIKAFGSQFAEVLSERTGGALAFMPGAEKLRLLKTSVMKRWFGMNPDASPGTFAKLINATGWNGVLGEMFEERVGDAMKAGMGLQSWSDVIPTPRQLLVEAAAFAVPGPVGSVGRAALRKVTRQNSPPGSTVPPNGSSAAPVAGSAPVVDARPSRSPASLPQPAEVETSPSHEETRMPELAQPSVVEPGPAGASSSATEPATLPAEGNGVELLADRVEAAPESHAAETELDGRTQALEEISPEAPPLHSDVLKHRGGALRERAAQAGGTRATMNNAPARLRRDAFSESGPVHFNAGTPSEAITDQAPQRADPHPPAVNSATNHAPAASPAPSSPRALQSAQVRMSSQSPASTSEWGQIDPVADRGATVETTNGKAGIVVAVDGPVVKFRKADGTLDAAHLNRARIVQPQRQGNVASGRAVPERASTSPDALRSDLGHSAELSDGAAGDASQDSGESLPGALPRSAEEAITALEKNAAFYDAQIAGIEAREKDPRVPFGEKKALFLQRKNLVAARNQRARELVSVPVSERGKVVVPSKIPAALEQSVGRGLELVSRYADAKLMPTVYVQMIPAEDRGLYVDGLAMIPKDASALTVAHEVTHGLELQNPQVLLAAEAFLKRRTIGESPKPLAELMGEPQYGADEMALEDRWKELGGSPYCGKVYPEGTELLTMGIERLDRSPLHFAREDPEYFSFVVNTLRQW